MDINTYSALQITAISEAGNLNFLKNPDTSTLKSEYYNLGAVPGSENIWLYIKTNPTNITANNLSLLKGLGANSFPIMFGVVPFNEIGNIADSSNIGFGMLFDKVDDHINNQFGSISDASIYLQGFTQAQIYASSAKNVFKSSLTSNFGSKNDINYLITGGISNITGNNPATIQTISSAFGNIGSLINFSNPTASFSASDIFCRILNSGYNWIGNLHVNFYNKTIVDPITGDNVQITSSLLNSIVSNTTQFSADNSLEKNILNLADIALSQTTDLDAVISYVGISGDLANRISKFSDCTNVPFVFGDAAVPLSININGELTANSIISSLVNNIKGFENITNSNELASVLSTVQTINNSSIISNVFANSFSNIKSLIGIGTGIYGQPTVADILGGTLPASALSGGINALNLLKLVPISNIIISDTSNLVVALQNNSSNGIFLSNGQTFNTLDELVSAAVPLIDNNANILSASATSMEIINDIDAYNSLAANLNNSSQLLKKAGIDPSSYKSNFNVVVAFINDLPTITTGDNEIFGLSTIQPLINANINCGKALNAIIVESQNLTVLNNSGIQVDTYTPSALIEGNIGDDPGVDSGIAVLT